MHLMVAALTILGAIFGFAAAWWWHKASKVTAIPSWVEARLPEPVDVDQQHDGWMVGVLNAAKEQARLNAIAAGLTALAVALNAAAGLIATLC